MNGLYSLQPQFTPLASSLLPASGRARPPPSGRPCALALANIHIAVILAHTLGRLRVASTWGSL